MKNNISFFTHETDAYSNRKFLILRAYYGGEKGWAMEARFWALNCIIGRANDSKLNLNQKGERAVVARELEMSTKELAEFIAVLRDEAELIHDDDGILWTQQTQDDLQRAMKTRDSAARRRSEKFVNESEKFVNENERNTKLLNESIKSLNELEKLSNENHVVDKIGVDKIGQEKTREERASAPPLTFETFAKSIVDFWNASEVKPAFRFTTSVGLTSKEREGFSVAVNRYSLDEVEQAIKNYAGISQSSRHEPFPKGYGLPGFLTSGIEQYLDAAKPWERCEGFDDGPLPKVLERATTLDMGD